MHRMVISATPNTNENKYQMNNNEGEKEFVKF